MKFTPELEAELLDAIRVVRHGYADEARLYVFGKASPEVKSYIKELEKVHRVKFTVFEGGSK